jgi:hypothetical protein
MQVTTSNVIEAPYELVSKDPLKFILVTIGISNSIAVREGHHTACNAML